MGIEIAILAHIDFSPQQGTGHACSGCESVHPRTEAVADSGGIGGRGEQQQYYALVDRWEDPIKAGRSGAPSVLEPYSHVAQVQSPELPFLQNHLCPPSSSS